MSKKNSRKSRNKKKSGSFKEHVAKKIQEPWVQDIERYEKIKVARFN